MAAAVMAVKVLLALASAFLWPDMDTNDLVNVTVQTAPFTDHANGG